MIIQILSFTIDIKKAVFDFRLKWAVKEAKSNAKLFGKKYLVINYAGKPRVYQKAALKDLIYRRKIFKKGTTVEQLERMAFYVTN